MGDRRRVRWGDRSGKVVILSPCLAASAAVGVCMWSDAIGRAVPPGLGPVVCPAVLALNAALSVAGSTAGGLLVGGTVAQRLAAASEGAVVGLFGYVLALVGIGLLAFVILLTVSIGR